MKKIRFLFLALILVTMCTGCTIEYNININEDTINEYIDVKDYITPSRTQGQILSHYSMWYPVFVNYVTKGESIELENFNEKASGVEYYEKDIKNINNGYNYTYKYNYSLKDYYDSYALATTFVKTTIQKNGNSLVLKSSKENLLCNYDEFDTLKINITIDPEVYELNYTNTKNKNKNTYTWILNRDNCNDSEIILTLDKISSNKTVIEDKKTSSEYEMYIFCGILLLLILIGYFIFKIVKKKNDEFNIDD